MISRPSATAPANAQIARIVVRIACANASWPSVASRPARWGSSDVWIDWKSCSGARVISSALKTAPATAALALPLATITPTLTSVCSASWMPATASAKPALARSVIAAASGAGASASSREWRAIAHGITSSEAIGAARMPAATAVCPLAMPIATASGKQNRETDSNRTRPP